MNSISNWIFSKNIEKKILDLHRDHLLFQTKICCFILFLLVPFTILPYFYMTRIHLFGAVIKITSLAMLVFLLIAFVQETKFFKKHYYLPSFLLIMTCTMTTSIVILIEKTAPRHFLFPYFLTNFGYATLLPAPFLYGFGTLAIIPLSYFIVEWISGLPFGTPMVVSNMISLIDAMVLALIANQILFSLFIRDKRNQLKLQTANEKLFKITSQVAHDIRSPLTSIQAVLEHWRETSLNNEYLTLLDLSAKRLHAIANEVLSSNHLKKTSHVFSIHRLLDELIGEYTSIHPQVKFKKKYGEAFSCHGNRDRIQRAFENLFKNSIEAMKEKGQLTLSTSFENNCGVITFADTGSGITSEKLQKILQGGYTDGKSGGHGIGMSVVKEVVEEHKGQLQAESQLGIGTTFRILFPLPDSQTLRSSLVEEGAGSIEFLLARGEQVVVIDDDPSIQLQWELNLRKQGVDPLLYESYEDFERKKHERPSLHTAIIDYHYDNSEFTGFEIIEKLKQVGFSNLTLCTGEYWKPQIQQRAKAAGITICPKPLPKIIIRSKN